MSKFWRRIFLFFAGIFLTVTAFAQDTLIHEKPQMAGLMRSNGKIYVVVTVLAIILAGLFIYLIQLDKKITRLEKADRK